MLLDDAALRALVHDAQTGDPDAFRRLVRRVYDTMFRWAVTQTADADDAEDAVQGALVKLHRNLPGYRGDARFTTWLYRVTRSAVSEFQRVAPNRRSAESFEIHQDIATASEDDVAGRIDARNMMTEVRSLFLALPERQRTVFDLADLQGFNATEIAGMLDMEPVTVRANLLKARRRIRRQLVLRRPSLAEERGNDT